MISAEQLRQIYLAGETEIVKGLSPTACDEFDPDWKCHENVVRWVAAHPTHHIVRGWIASGDRIFDGHSVVATESGLLDVTPRVSEQRQPFIRHPGSDDEFWRCRQQMVCMWESCS